MVVLRSGRCYFDLKGWNIRRKQMGEIVCDYLNVYIWSSEVMGMVTDPNIVEIDNLFDNAGWNDPSWPNLKGFKSNCEYTPMRCLELVELKIAEFIIMNKNKRTLTSENHGEI
jgi:hypothetical protein